MSLRSKLFKKAWQNRDPAIRAQAVAELQDAQLKAALPHLAQADDDALVRLAALKRLNAEPFWLDARLRESEPSICQAADQFLARELLQCERPDLEAARIEWLNQLEDHDLLRRVAARSPGRSARRAALARINAPGFLGDCFLSEPDDMVAAEILTRIDQISTLERILPAARRASKQRAQALSDRLERLKVAAGQAVAGQAASEPLVLEVEALSRGQPVGDVAQTLQRIRQQWDRISEHPETLRRRFDGAVGIVETALQRSLQPSEPRPVDSLEVAPETRADEPAPDQALAASAQFIRSHAKPSAEAPARELLAHWDRSWNRIPVPGPADAALKAEMLPVLRELQAQVQRETARKAAMRERAAGMTSAADRQAAAVGNFHGRLDAIAQSLESGHLTEAHRQIQSLRGDHDRLPAAQRPGSDSARLQRMEGRLKEMRHWQHWSNNKVREQLIATVRQCIEGQQHPDAIMAVLKQARNDWKQLESMEHFPGERRRFAAPPEQWRQFQTACAQAYAISQPYLARRDQRQHDSLETLQSFTRAGLALAADEQSDADALLGFLRKARQALQRMDDLPAKSRAASAASLRELMNALSVALDQRYSAVEAAKRRLLAQARALTEEKDRQTALDQAKALQSQWQKAGSGRRKVDQELWRAFREPMDQLFQQARSEQSQRRQAEQLAQSEAMALCQQIEALADLPEETLDSVRGRLQGLLVEWSRQPGRTQALNHRVERAGQRLEQRAAGHHQHLARQAQAQIEELATQVQQLWTQRIQGQAMDRPNPESSMPSADPIGSRLQALAQRIASEDFDLDAMAATRPAQLQAARQVAIELEFLAGLETPAADQALRMAYQVQRLASRMTDRQRLPDLANEVEQLQQRWYECLPLPPEQSDGLQARVRQALNILRSLLAA